MTLLELIRSYLAVTKQSSDADGFTVLLEQERHDIEAQFQQLLIGIIDARIAVAKSKP